MCVCTQTEYICIQLYIRLCILCICVGLTLFTYSCYSCLYITEYVYVSLSVEKACRHAVSLVPSGFTLRFGVALFHGCKITCFGCMYISVMTKLLPHTCKHLRNSKKCRCDLTHRLCFHVRYCFIETSASMLVLPGANYSQMYNYISNTQSFKAKSHHHVHILMTRVGRDRKALHHSACQRHI